jgi:hypothetical protein
LRGVIAWCIVLLLMLPLIAAAGIARAVAG